MIDVSKCAQHVHFQALGSFKGRYTPGLLGNYGTMACVRNLWNDHSANVSGGERAGDCQ